MSKLWKSLLASPAICGAMLFVSAAAFAGETPAISETSEPLVMTNTDAQVENISQEQVMSQVTSVSQLSDVQATDWAFQALQSLVERYGCIAGYPNGTYRGNRALTRYEFAAGLNACLDRVNELIATGTADLVTKEDLTTLQKLQEEFSAELATLRGRVDALEAKTSELEANQFSTTTKLQGQVVTVISDVLSGDKVGTNITDKNTTLGARARIELVSSFTGQDTLFTRIQTNNILSPDINTREGNLFFAGTDGTNDAFIDLLYYAFPLGKATQVKLIANAGAPDDVTSTVNIFDGDGGFGALSTFGTRNPIYNQISGAGLAVNQYFSRNVSLSLAYLAAPGVANNPAPKNGLFDGGYGALAQLTVKPSDRIAVGLTYINSYKQPLLTGSNAATTDITNEAFSSNSYGLQASIGVSDKFVLGGWAGYTNSRILTGNRGDVDIWNYAVTLGFPDLGKKGNLAGIIVGMEPKVTSSNVTGLSEDQDTSYHVEAFYQYKVSDNITITPGIIWLTAPDHNNDNDNVVIGALRTTFSF
ncbi:iron uptake porin [Cylindrospermum sp. FACHB-282]|uniref:iron uptake porin n=1 Tax=Cylindrospermum sp. FACHB-282 TaxID=2692794 RepID=UPI0016866770|nr:iron uptake porin [Cylindrospermum sp. FACHB-282]MBD2386758.1 iron uptake porin [Cylindrospermum sp. FACHB-282]